jgi:hypothetical protein
MAAIHIPFTVPDYSARSTSEGTMNYYDPLADLIQVAEDCCADRGQLSKAAALQTLQTVLRANPELSRELQRRMAAELRYGGRGKN